MKRDDPESTRPQLPTEERCRCSYQSYGVQCANMGTMTESVSHRTIDDARWFCGVHFFRPSDAAALEYADSVVQRSQSSRGYLATVEEIRHRYRTALPAKETEIEVQVRSEIPSAKGVGWARRIVRIKELGGEIPDTSVRIAQQFLAEKGLGPAPQ